MFTKAYYIAVYEYSMVLAASVMGSSVQYKLTVTMFSAARSGTTVTFVIIDGWVVTVASVGDSRCILESAEGTVYFLSADHRLDANEEEYVDTSNLSSMTTISSDLRLT
jgi:serine/threonine protein phosphatase PrpC